MTKSGRVIFGKNSDRPQNEVQEVVLVKSGLRDPKLKVSIICNIFLLTVLTGENNLKSGCLHSSVLILR